MTICKMNMDFKDLKEWEKKVILFINLVQDWRIWDWCDKELIRKIVLWLLLKFIFRNFKYFFNNFVLIKNFDIFPNYHKIQKTLIETLSISFISWKLYAILKY